MNSEKEKGTFNVRNIQFSSIVSMSLVLFLIGLVSLLLFVARDMGKQIKENINLSLVLNDNASASNIKRIEKYLKASDFVKSQEFISKEDALKEHVATMGDNPAKFLGFNPLMASIEIKLNADYANVDSVAMIETKLKKFESINRIAYQKDMVSLVNENVTRISLFMLTIATILLLISVALINNTIRVSIYANRFLINTMKLVGATHWFIRKPYIKSGMINGVFASLLALLMLGGLTWYVLRETGLNLFALQTMTLINVAIIVVVVGVLLTGLSSYLAVGRYLRMQTNQMYFV
jgi:cell division transport system permease protein